MITQEELKSLVHYDPETGVFTRLSRWAQAYEGKVLGCKNTQGYSVFSVKNKIMYAHRLAWIYVHGNIPMGMMLDHIDGDRLNNRLSNLRLATAAQNTHNSRSYGKSSEFKGVFFHKHSGLYIAKLTVNKKVHYLGYYKNPREAAEEVIFKALELQGEYARAA